SLEQPGSLLQQLRCVSHVFDDVSEKNGREFALDFRESIAFEIHFVNLRADAPGDLRQLGILLDAHYGALFLPSEIFGKVSRPASDIQYRFAIVEEFSSLQHVAASLPCVTT